MRRFLQVLVMSMLTLGVPACGSPSQAELDCDEFNRLIEHLRVNWGTVLNEQPFNTLDTQVCSEWIESTSTRCQQVFFALAVCSRSYHSTPQVARAECLSELMEVEGACVLPPVKQPA